MKFFILCIIPDTQDHFYKGNWNSTQSKLFHTPFLEVVVSVFRIRKPHQGLGLVLLAWWYGRFFISFLRKIFSRVNFPLEKQTNPHTIHNQSHIPNIILWIPFWQVTFFIYFIWIFLMVSSFILPWFLLFLLESYLIIS